MFERKKFEIEFIKECENKSKGIFIADNNITFNDFADQWLEEIRLRENAYGSYVSASYRGIGVKTLLYIVITIIGAALGIYMFINNPNAYVTTLIISGILTFVCALLAMSVPKASMICGSLYCLFEGAFIGILSLLIESLYQGYGSIVITAALGTISVVLVVCVLYFTGLIKVTNGFMRFLFMAGFGFMISMLFLFILQLYYIFYS